MKRKYKSTLRIKLWYPEFIKDLEKFIGISYFRYSRGYKFMMKKSLLRDGDFSFFNIENGPSLHPSIKNILYEKKISGNPED